MRSRRKVVSETQVDREWRETFLEAVWPDWLAFKPGCSRADALRAWMQIPHAEGQADFDRVWAAFVQYRDSKAGEPVKYRKDAATWINGYRRELELEHELEGR